MSTSRAEFGISLHRVDRIADAAREFEELGYDYLTCGEHVSFNVPVSNSFISLAVAAGATSRIKLMNSIALVPLYPAALLAQLGAALDVASGFWSTTPKRLSSLTQAMSGARPCQRNSIMAHITLRVASM